MVCQYCGSQFRGRGRSLACSDPVCIEKNRLYREELRKGRVQAVSKNFGRKCQFPGCTKKTGHNFFWCETHHALVSRQVDGYLCEPANFIKTSK